VVTIAWDVMMPVNEVVLRAQLIDVCVAASTPQEQLVIGSWLWFAFQEILLGVNKEETVLHH
jgi:hypothetical protein